MAVLTEDGALFTWGRSVHGVLGHSRSGQDAQSRGIFAQRPARVAGLAETKAIKDVALGGSHTLALTADGLVLAWGSGRQGQLGPCFGEGTNSHDKAALRANLPGERLLKSSVPRKVGPVAPNVTAIAAGAMSSAAVADDGRVLLWGSGIPAMCVCVCVCVCVRACVHHARTHTHTHTVLQYVCLLL